MLSGPEALPPRAGRPDAARVLLVEDDALIRDLVAGILADEGFAVRTAADCAHALDQGTAWVPDVIVLDLTAPDAGGRGLMREQARDGHLAGVPVVVMSATEQDEHLGAAFLREPLDLGALLEQVGRLAARTLARR